MTGPKTLRELSADGATHVHAMCYLTAGSAALAVEG